MTFSNKFHFIITFSEYFFVFYLKFISKKKKFFSRFENIRDILF